MIPHMKAKFFFHCKKQKLDLAQKYLQLPLWQCLPRSVVQLKGKHFRKPHCHNGIVDMFGLSIT